MNIPDVLWHYTDAVGLHGIISSGVLRLTDVRFLNDRTERTYGSAIVSALLDDMVREGDLNAKAVDPKHIGDKVAGERLYVCSLTECSDSLSQWQRYAADGYGYCIGFSPIEFLPLGGTGTSDFRLPSLDRVSGVWDPLTGKTQRVYEPLTLRQMLYDASAQAEKTRRCVNDVLSRVEPAEKAAPYLRLALDELEVQFKNPLFEDEREWRLIQQTHDDSRKIVQFATKGPYVRPYVESRAPIDQPRPRLPIKAIICGPRLDDDLAITAVKEFLVVNGHSVYEVQLRMSRLRGTWR